MDCFPIFEGSWWQKCQICLLLNGRSGFHGDQAKLICCFADHAPYTTSTLAVLKSGWTQLRWQVCTVFYTVSLQLPPPPTGEPGRGLRGRAAFLPLWVASLRMLFENGTLHPIVINIVHVSQCFLDFSVRLSGNIKRCLFSLFQCTFWRLWIHRWYFL